MISMIYNMGRQHSIRIHEGESFKQALYNGRLSDSEDELRDKIALAAKHYAGRDLLISTYESDETSPRQFAFAVVMPVVG
jgi:hypothetical protein